MTRNYAANLRVEPLVRALLDGVGAERTRVDLGVVPVFSDERPLLGLAGLIDWRGSGCLSAVLRSGFSSSAAGEQMLVPCDRRLPIDRLVLVGLGRREQYDEVRARALAEQFVRVAIGLSAPTVLIALPTHGMDRTLTEVVFQSLIATIEEHEHEAQPITTDAVVGDPEPSESTPVELEPEPAPASQEPSRPDASRPSGPDSRPSGLDSVRWWVAADEAVVARLRRVLSGPPRATRGGAGLHT